MSYRPKLQLHPPSNWQDFEILCWGLWKKIWGDAGTRRNGRQGQAQHGVDIFGQPDTGVGWAGVQCKGKENFTNQTLTKKHVTAEVWKAKQFTPKLAEYTIATTAPRDEGIQADVRRATTRLEKGGWFRLSVCGWDDIEELLYEHEPPIARRFYPDVFGGQMAGFVKLLLEQLSEPRSLRPNEGPKEAYPADGRAAGEHTTVVTDLAPGTEVTADAVATGNPQQNVRARDVGLALQTLSRLEEEFARNSDAHGATSSDAKLADAVSRAVRGRANV